MGGVGSLCAILCIVAGMQASEFLEWRARGIENYELLVAIVGSLLVCAICGFYMKIDWDVLRGKKRNRD
jgi:hypothetical protein